MQQDNYRAQLDQVNQNYRAGLEQGLTPGQAATTWVLPNGKNKQYTVKDGDDLTKIATATGTSEADILAANPDMSAPQTGMVLNTPPPPAAPGSEAWRVQNTVPPPPVTNYVGGVAATAAPTANQMDIYRQGKQAEALRNRGLGGLPSNAAFGANTTNPQGNNPTVIPGPHNVDFANSPFMQGLQALKNGVQAAAGVNMFEALKGGGVTPPSVVKPPPTYKKTSYAPRENLVTLLDSITSQTGPTGRLPTDFELKLLINSARVKPVESNVSPGGGFGGGGYFGGYRRRGGYGGGGYGGYRGGGGYSQKKRAPAFSSGAGFGGLVNWRI